MAIWLHHRADLPGGTVGIEGKVAVDASIGQALRRKGECVPGIQISPRLRVRGERLLVALLLVAAERCFLLEERAPFLGNICPRPLDCDLALFCGTQYRPILLTSLAGPKEEGLVGDQLSIALVCQRCFVGLSRCEEAGHGEQLEGRS